MTPPSQPAQGGFSLIELLVVVLLLGMVGSIIVGGLVRGIRASDEAQARIEAFEDMQIALERISRDVRAASTPLAAVLEEAPDGDPLAVGEGLEFEVLRDRGGTCVRYTYWVDPADALRVSEEHSTDFCDTFGAASERVLVRELGDRSVFTFEKDQYDDGDRIEVTSEELEDGTAAIRFVTISLTRTPFEHPVTVSTVVGLRNPA